MKKLLLLLAACAVAAAPAVASAKIVRTVEKTFAVQPGGNFKAATSGGDITVRTADVAEVHIVATETIQASSEQQADDLLKNLELTLAQSGNDVTAEAKYHRGTGFFNFGRTPVTVSFTVTVPAKFNLSLHTSGGDIGVAGLAGHVEARTSGGSMKFERVDGDLNAGTSGGDIRIEEGSARARLNTSGGSIHLTRAGGPVEADTSGGDIEIESAAQVISASTSGGSVRATLTEAPKQDMVLSTSGGNVTVRLPKTAAFELDAGTSGGSVDAAGLTMTLTKGAIGRSHLSGTVNGGGPRLKLRTSGGNVVVRAE